MTDLPQDNSARNSAIEPIALQVRRDDDGQIRLSIAISLKRIADAMERQTISSELLFDEIPF